mmetsp:Transcript_41072/g.47264  ORF Transcript_41072/g.47264 Transcript_41072/m.47264 type:complete len:82 (-) Transcript_41072:1265-1510(-)
MFKFMEDSNITPNSTLWKKYKVERKQKVYEYKNKNEYMIDIVGSSKDVNALYREIESKMIESFDFSNEGFDFFKDKITWPP